MDNNSGFFCRVNLDSKVAVYLQLENQICFAIAAGRLKAGDRLPSVREMSEMVDLNPNTVAKAYRDLEVMGYLYTRRGTGVYVSQDGIKNCRKNCYKLIADRVHEVTCEAKAAGLSQKDLIQLVRDSYSTAAELYEQTPKSVHNSAADLVN